MVVVEISAFVNFSVGNIMRNLKEEIEKNGDTCIIFYGRGGNKKEHNIIKFNNNLAVKKNAIMARIFDNDGLCDRYHTKKLIKELKNIKPDVVHLHCLHGYYINYKLLFRYLNESNIKVIWTMHDVWAFTGHCCYYDYLNCFKWKEQCFKCLAKSDYPKSQIIDNSKLNYINKKSIFTSIKYENMVLVSPSIWMDSQVTESFLNGYKHIVIYNGMNLEVFKDKNNRREKILLAVASVWDDRKNLEAILNISKNLKQWKLIVVGKVQEKIIKDNPNILFIPRTTDQAQLIELYNKAAVFVNPTKGETFGMVNIEAQLCGCHVLSSNVGGTAETDCGRLLFFSQSTFIDDDFLNDLYNKKSILKYYKKFDKSEMSKQYYRLYKELLDSRISKI